MLRICSGRKEGSLRVKNKYIVSQRSPNVADSEAERQYGGDGVEGREGGPSCAW